MREDIRIDLSQPDVSRRSPEKACLDKDRIPDRIAPKQRVNPAGPDAFAEEVDDEHAVHVAVG
jgi:hypothetical protein